MSNFFLIGSDQNFITIFIENFRQKYRKFLILYQKFLTIFIEIYNLLSEKIDHFYHKWPFVYIVYTLILL